MMVVTPGFNGATPPNYVLLVTVSWHWIGRNEIMAVINVVR